MPTTPYHHGHLREALVAEAVAAARERGPEGLALRELARRVGVSHNAAYRHFADRDALVGEVAMAGLRRMMEVLTARTDALTETDPVLLARRRLREVAFGYLDFALGEPGLFRVVFTAFPVIDDPRKADIDPDIDTFGMLERTLDGLVDVGYLAPEARPGAEISCWSAVHGFAMLHLDGPMRGVDPADREAMLDVLVVALDRSYGATTGHLEPLPPRDRPAAVPGGRG
jgi:AcrR family transcriptional regulator